MIAKAQADSVCAFFGNVELISHCARFSLICLTANLGCTSAMFEINFTLRSVFTKFVSLQMITLWDCLTEV